ncbi:hypothetical protein PAXRUDRAFT_832422 [Paxillus rubicundulus Ve08.2h10]|uniref:Cell cycle checkpoint protein RAD17 n=1 Tax=Paxillus rubicundulus Ve08.2h10 TaxID=930991 RepID=A0A0D0DCV1_9AGAM|nr:hypothetical protein PAXRUDRAFT_832422 [Paxillus rubicundulus Ve08.2h10]
MSRKPSSKSLNPTSALSTKKNIKTKFKTLKLQSRDSDHDSELHTNKSRPGAFSLSNPPIFDVMTDDASTGSSSQAAPARSHVANHILSLGQYVGVDVKRKRKWGNAGSLEGDDDQLWVDKYEPTSEAELAVHKRKVEDVRRWLLEAFEGGPSAKLTKYRRILALTGPAGTAKTATLRVLARELGFEILEWRNGMSQRGPSSFTDEGFGMNDELRDKTEALFDKFQAFLTRAMTCNSIFGSNCNAFRLPPFVSPSPLQSYPHTSAQSSIKRQLILLEDLPNLLHQPTQARFQAALHSMCIPATNSPATSGPPIVIVLSDSGIRAEQADDETWDDGGGGGRRRAKEVLDIRNVLGPELLRSPYVTRIGFNPIAPTLMTKALQALLSLHHGSRDSSGRAGEQPPREVLDVIVESSNGDIRSAIMALQFACIVDLPSTKRKKKRGGRKTDGGASGTQDAENARVVLAAVTMREQSLVLFHLMGKILYNKRKFDPPAAHLSAKDALKERQLDAQLIDPLLLPVWLSHHDRKASRVCVETLTMESPIDSFLLGTYIHQNYTQFCTDIDQCDGICEGLSWVDCVSGTQFTSTPYAFPTLTLSTLHSLPTPVLRAGQKVCKPAWFDLRAKEMEAWNALGDVLGWLGRDGGRGGSGGVGGGEEKDKDEEVTSISLGKWTHTSIATELGGWLRAVDWYNSTAPNVTPQSGPRYRHEHRPYPQVPRTHRLFSCVPWTSGVLGGDALGENEDSEGGGEDESENGDGDVRVPSGMKNEKGKGWWLEDDDIEEAG